MAEQLTLAELKERAKALGYPSIQHQVEPAQIVALDTWSGLSMVAWSEFSHVSVWYVLDGSKVTVRKAVEPDTYYVLS